MTTTYSGLSKEAALTQTDEEPLQKYLEAYLCPSRVRQIY